MCHGYEVILELTMNGSCSWPKGPLGPRFLRAPAPQAKRFPNHVHPTAIASLLSINVSKRLWPYEQFELTPNKLTHYSMTPRIRIRPRALRACICSSNVPIHHTYASRQFTDSFCSTSFHAALTTYVQAISLPMQEMPATEDLRDSCHFEESDTDRPSLTSTHIRCFHIDPRIVTACSW